MAALNQSWFLLSSSSHWLVVVLGLIVSLLATEVNPAVVGRENKNNILSDDDAAGMMVDEPAGDVAIMLPIDRMDAEQFVRLFDRLMDGQISRIMEQIKSNAGASDNKIELIPANQLSARQFIKLLDFYSSGAVSSRLRSLLAGQQRFNSRSGWQAASRPRRMAGFDSMNGVSIGYSKRTFDPMNGISLGAASPSKRGIHANFDEMDRAGFSGFAKRRAADFDELDHAGFSGFAKRFDEMDHSGFSGFAKRSADFDEIDRSGFHGFLKRRLPSAESNFDEIDHSGFSNFVKRLNNFDEMDRAGFSSFAKRSHNFDEMDRAGFTTGAFAKRMNFDELDHSGFTGFRHGYGKRFLVNPLVSIMAARTRLQPEPQQQQQQQRQSNQSPEPENVLPISTSAPVVTVADSETGNKN